MKKSIILLLIVLFNFNLSFSQTKSEIDSLLNGISEIENYSREIITTEQAKEILNFGDNSLKILSYFFTDTTLTKVKSKCEERNLTKGEIAIIIADKIEEIPIFTLLEVRNRLFSSHCMEVNPNKVEFFFFLIKEYGTKKFKRNYMAWLNSDDRIESILLLDKKSKS